MPKNRVSVDGGWEVSIPDGFIYSTDKSVIGDWHNIIIMENKPGNDYSDSFNASISFTSQINEIENARAVVDMMVGLTMSGTPQVIRDDDMYVSYSFEDSYTENGRKTSIFHIKVAYQNAISSIQVWFNGGRKSYDAQKRLVEQVATSIRPVVKYNDTGFTNTLSNNRLEALTFNSGEEVLIDNTFTVPVPDGYQYSTNPSVIDATRHLVIVPETYDIHSDPMGAPYGVTILSQTIDLGKRFNLDNVEFLPVFFTENANFFVPGVNVSHFLPEEGMGIFYQIVYGDPDNSWNKVLVVIAADTKAYIMTIIYNHADLDGRATDVIQNLHDVSLEFLDRIALKKSQRKKGKSIRVSFDTTTPDMDLYPHYYHMQNDGNALGMALPGVQVITNSSGTEYSLQPLSDMHREMQDDLKNGDDVNADVVDALERVNAIPLDDYDLDKEASKMQGLFRVNKDIFDMRHDREAELDNGYIRRAYMFNALRSFGWTLASYCKKKKTKPESVSLEVLTKLVDYIKDRNWLNYDDSSYCKGLCSGQDIFTFYLTDDMRSEDRKYFLPTDEDLEKMNSQPMLSGALPTGIESLEALRKDLEYLYPAVKTIYDNLKQFRDSSVALEGDLSDIVYAWIAMAKAAKTQFYLNEGPMSYLLSQPYNEEEYRKEEEERLKKEEKKWLDEYGQYIDKNANIVFKDRKFVFTGVSSYDYSHDTDTAKLVEDKGGVIRSKVSGLTDYLVVYPAAAGASKIENAIEQKNKGKSIKIILLDDLLAALGLTEKKSNDEPTVVSAPQTNDDSNGLPPEMQEAKEEVDRAIADLKAQAAFYESQNLSAEDRETLNAIKQQISALEGQMSGAETDQARFAEVLKQKEEREKAEKEEHARKTAEAKAKGKSEDDEINMYVILTNEEKMGQIKRSDKDFYEKYQDDFAALNKKETLELRKTVLSKMKDKDYQESCRKSFMARSVEDRFKVSTKNYFNASTTCDYALKADQALESTKVWYEQPELNEVKKLVDKNLEGLKEHIDEQLRPVEVEWTKWNTAKNYLKVFIRRQDDADVNKQKDCELFQYERTFYPFGDDPIPVMVEVLLCTRGVYQMRCNVMNFFALYWDVSYEDIWKAAKKADIRDEVGANYSCDYLIDDSLAEIKKKYPDAKTLKKKAEAAKKSASTKFVKGIKELYFNATHFDDSSVSEADIKKIIDSAFKSPENLAECGSNILKSIDKASMSTLYNLIENETDSQKLYNEIPKQLSEDINVVYERAKAERQEKERKDKIDKVRNEIASTKESIEQLETGIRENTAKLADLKAEFEGKTAELKGKREVYDPFFEEEKEKWRIQSDEIQEEITDSRLYIEKLQEQISEKKHELSTLSFLQFGRKKELTSIIEGLTNEVQKEQSNRDQLVSKRNSAEKEYHDRINGPQKEINNIISCLPGMKESIDSLTKQIEDDKKSLEAQTEKLPELEKELARVNEQRG